MNMVMQLDNPKAIAERNEFGSDKTSRWWRDNQHN
jgi:hypothetical protein